MEEVCSAYLLTTSIAEGYLMERGVGLIGGEARVDGKWVRINGMGS